MHGGINIEQDPKFAHKLAKRSNDGKNFPEELKTKVVMQKVHLDSIKPWIHRRTSELLDGVEDEILADFIVSMLESSPEPDPREFLDNLEGFLADKTQVFVVELWRLLCDGQQSLGGIPTAFVQEKKDELLRKKYEDGKRRLMDRKLSSAGQTSSSSTESSSTSTGASDPNKIERKMTEMERIMKEEDEKPQVDQRRRQRERSTSGNDDDTRDYRARMERRGRRTYYERSPERLRTSKPETSRSRDRDEYHARKRYRSRSRSHSRSGSRDRYRRGYSRSRSPYDRQCSRRSKDVYDRDDRLRKPRSRSISRRRYDDYYDRGSKSRNSRRS